MKISAGVSDMPIKNMWKHVYACSHCKLRVSKIWDRNDKSQSHMMTTTCVCNAPAHQRAWVYVSDAKYEFKITSHVTRKAADHGNRLRTLAEKQKTKFLSKKKKDAQPL